MWNRFQEPDSEQKNQAEDIEKEATKKLRAQLKAYKSLYPRLLINSQDTHFNLLFNIKTNSHSLITNRLT
jgi:hypothetical protein